MMMRRILLNVEYNLPHETIWMHLIIRGEIKGVRMKEEGLRG
jgi:hypothetical protein